MITIHDIKNILPDICDTYRIKYVELFGSIARNEEKEDYDM
jgi:predicted nucleotidyltransferase